MNIRVLAATLVGGITMTLVGWLLFGVLLANYFKANMIIYAGLEKTPPDWISLLLFNLAFAWLIAFVFDRWANIRNLAGGIKGGVLIMLPIGIALGFQQMAFMNLYKSYVPVIVDILIVTVIGAVAGAVIGLVLGAMSKTANLE
ncbi:MAG TPA: hypothetical protein VGC76_17810 [Pyrinomonadaceae bacterium]|jgi:hypothetical protein